jgi:hypothetical protein
MKKRTPTKKSSPKKPTPRGLPSLDRLESVFWGRISWWVFAFSFIPPSYNIYKIRNAKNQVPDSTGYIYLPRP